MTYFHTGICTIIGAKSFHCPVRDGKEWDQLAMVIRHKRVVRWLWLGQRGEFIESIISDFDCAFNCALRFWYNAVFEYIHNC